MTRKRLSLATSPMLALSALVILVGCKNADTLTGVRPDPTPTPAPVNITGDWTGTFSSVTSFAADDCGGSVQAHATFTQQDSVVEGTLFAETSGCGFNNVSFHGTLDGNTLTGTIRGGGPYYGFADGSTANGTLSGTTLTLTLTNHNQYRPSLIPGGSMQLHR